MKTILKARERFSEIEAQQFTFTPNLDATKSVNKRTPSGKAGPASLRLYQQATDLIEKRNEDAKNPTLSSQVSLFYLPLHCANPADDLTCSPSYIII